MYIDISFPRSHDERILSPAVAAGILVPQELFDLDLLFDRHTVDAVLHLLVSFLLYKVTLVSDLISHSRYGRYLTSSLSSFFCAFELPLGSSLAS